MSFSYDFMFDRIMCVLVRIKVRGHLVMSIIQLINLISMHFWTNLTNQGLDSVLWPYEITFFSNFVFVAL